MNAGNRKGAGAEELLRDYFLKSGYFVVRGLPVFFADADVTDVDLWLYVKPGVATRWRAGVDIKHKARPKALERIVWAKGLQSLLTLDEVMVATTDKRPDVKAYGQANGVKVLDGTFLEMLSSSTKVESTRLTEEEFLEPLKQGKADKLYDGWVNRVEVARSRLLTQLEFDGCNAWLDDIRFFLEHALTDTSNPVPGRLTYSVTSYFLIGLDASILDRACGVPDDVRRRVLDSGFRFGSDGGMRSQAMVETAARLIEAYAPKSKGLGAQIRAGVAAELEKLRVEVLAEYFSRNAVYPRLFAVARKFEELAYARTYSPPSALDMECRSVFAVMLDFFGIDRPRALAAAEVVSKPDQASAKQEPPAESPAAAENSGNAGARRSAEET